MDYPERTSIGIEQGAGLARRIVNGECDKSDGHITVVQSGGADGNPSIERVSEDGRVPPWWEQMTLRGLVVSLLMGITFNIIVMRLNLTTGIIPSLNVSAALLGFFFVRIWTKILEICGLPRTPFTPQENTVIQTCVVACYGIAFSGGFGSYLLGMARQTYERAGIDTKGNSPDSVKDPGLGWMIGFLMVVSFLGLLGVVPLRKIMVLDYKLTYPSGTATAMLINGFHTPLGDKLARKQILYLGKYFTISFLWSFFQWFFSGDGDNCGFAAFPTFGLRAFKQKFYFDFSLTYVGAGMICPHLVNVSMLIGAIISWGLMWPLIENQEGHWYHAGLSANSMRGIQGYRVFLAIALIIGDGLYNFVKILYITLGTMHRHWKIAGTEIPVANAARQEDPAPCDEQRRDEIFMKDGIPLWAAASGYVGLAAVSVAVIPLLFSQLKWYYVLAAYVVAPVFGFCNAYGMGLTDCSLASTYGKLALFVFASWAGKDGGGVLVGLAACGVMMSVVSTSADLMQDFKTGYLTLASPRSMFVSQVMGTAMGCVTAPLTFWMFYKTFDLGNPEGEYKAPYALFYRNMAILGVEGFSALPRHCLRMCYGLFALAIAINAVRDRLPNRISQYIPLPMAMAVPFYLGGYFTIDMCLGSAIVFAWQRMKREEAELLVPAVASGLMCGEGIWVLPASILALAKLNPPICMKFLSRHENQRVDKFLGS